MNKNLHSKVDWDTHHDRYVLYADIMGFKAKLKEMGHIAAVDELRRFNVAVSKHLSPYQTGGHLRMTLFSDLIVIASDRANIKCFDLIIHAAAALMYECHIFKFPINGCIACGPLAFDDPNQVVINAAHASPKISTQALPATQGRKGQYMPLFVGQSVVDAYLLNEEMFFYGIVLHKNAEKSFKNYISNKSSLGQTPFCYIPVPLKSGGYANLYYLDWPKVKLAKNSVAQADVEQYLNTLEPNVDVRARAYIYNTRQILTSLTK